MKRRYNVRIPYFDCQDTYNVFGCGGWDTWPPGCSLRFTGTGDQLTETERIILPALKPSEMFDASVEMESPEVAGIYQGQWRMYVCSCILTTCGMIHVVCVGVLRRASSVVVRIR